MKVHILSLKSRLTKLYIFLKQTFKNIKKCIANNINAYIGIQKLGNVFLND